MKTAHWSLMIIIAAAMGCAGSLDPNENYYPLTTQAKQTAGSKASMPDAGKPASNEPANSSSNNNNSSSNNNNNDEDASVTWHDSGWPATQEDDDAGTPSTKPDSGNSGGGSGSTKPDASAACDFRGLMQSKCGNASCHGAPATGTGLDLTSANLAMRVQGRKGAGACADKLLIDKDNPQDSKLYLKVSGSSCGVRMPLGGTLSISEEACILSWIEGL